MTQNLFFDTLEYAKMLKESGVELGEIHSTALKSALSHNIYTKLEVDGMLEATLKQVNENISSLRYDMDKNVASLREEMTINVNSLRQEMTANVNSLRQDMDKNIHDIRLEMKDGENNVVRRMTVNIGAISTILALVASVIHYIH